MSDRNSFETYTDGSDDAQDSPRATETLTVGVHAEDSLGRCPTDELAEFDWRLEFRRRIARERDCAGDGYPFDILPRTKEEPFEEFDEWRRKHRALELARKPKI